MAPKHKQSATTGKAKPRTRGTKAHNSETPAKRTRTATTTAMLTRTIHQQVTSQPHKSGTVTVSMAPQLKKPAKNNKLPSSRSTTVGVSTSCPSRSSVHPTRAQHPSFPFPSAGMGQPKAQLPTVWWGHWGPPPPWASFGSYPWPQQNQQQLVTSTPQTPQQTSHLANSFGGLSTTSPPTAAFQELSDNNSSEGSPAKDDAVNDPLINALAVSAIQGIKGQTYLSLHVANLIKKHIWVGQFIDLAYLLETQLVPEDSKSHGFACSNSANPNRLSLTSSKPKGKIDFYAAWNKAFRVYIELVALKWPDQCLPMIQHSADINDDTGKFPFSTTYNYDNYDIKFHLRRQADPSLPWNEIDNRLWSKCIAGGARENNFFSANFHPSSTPMNQDIKTCRDFNNGTCTQSICKFQHRCSKCFTAGHNQRQCRKQQRNITTQSAQSGNISTSNTNQSQQI